MYEEYEIAGDSEPESPPSVIEGITGYLEESDISILTLPSDSERPTYLPISTDRFDTSTPICDHTNTGGIGSANDGLARDQSMEIENRDETSVTDIGSNAANESPARDQSMQMEDRGSC